MASNLTGQIIFYFYILRTRLGNFQWKFFEISILADLITKNERSRAYTFIWLWFIANKFLCSEGGVYLYRPLSTCKNYFFYVFSIIMGNRFLHVNSGHYFLFKKKEKKMGALVRFLCNIVIQTFILFYFIFGNYL